MIFAFVLHIAAINFAIVETDASILLIEYLGNIEVVSYKFLLIVDY